MTAVCRVSRGWQSVQYSSKGKICVPVCNSLGTSNCRPNSHSIFSSHKNKSAHEKREKCSSVVLSASHQILMSESLWSPKSSTTMPSRRNDSKLSTSQVIFILFESKFGIPSILVWLSFVDDWEIFSVKLHPPCYQFLFSCLAF